MSGSPVSTLPERRSVGWRRILLINFGAAAVAMLALVAIRWPGGHELLRILAVCCLYSNVIGTLGALTLSRYGPDPRRQNPVVAWTLLVIELLGIVIAGMFLSGLLLVAVGLRPGSAFWPEFFGGTRFAAVIGLGVGISAFFYESLRSKLEQTTLELRTRQLEEERARKLAAEARLSSLESRIHPHFLFNTLNSIASLIPEDPRRAEEIVGKLAALLRFSLDAGRQSLVPLGQELKVVCDYLEIEKTRFGERLRFSIDVGPALEAVPVPPLSLQTLVENSVKFAVASRRQGATIRVTGQARDGRVQLEVADDGPGFVTAAFPPGHGLDNLQARLAALFGDAAKLDVQACGGETAVCLSLPQDHGCSAPARVSR